MQQKPAPQSKKVSHALARAIEGAAGRYCVEHGIDAVEAVYEQSPYRAGDSVVASIVLKGPGVRNTREATAMPPIRFSDEARAIAPGAENLFDSIKAMALMLADQRAPAWRTHDLFIQGTFRLWLKDGQAHAESIHDMRDPIRMNWF